MSKLKRYLDSHPIFFFHDMEEQYLDILDACSETREYKADACIFKAGDEAAHFHIIQTGEVSIHVKGAKGDNITIQTVSSGEVLGFSWMMVPYLYRFDATALEPTITHAFDARRLRKEIEKDRAFGYDLVTRFNQVISQRLQATRLQIIDMYGGFRLDDVK